jgi:hypothetical protein
MRRVIFGALTVAVAGLAAIGIIGRRRWAIRDDVLPLEPAPPLGAMGAVAAERALETMPSPPVRSSATHLAGPTAPTTSDADAPATAVARPARKKAATRAPKSAASSAPTESAGPAVGEGSPGG